MIANIQRQVNDQNNMVNQLQNRQLPNRCGVLITRGPRKNQRCNKPNTKDSNVCSYHKNKPQKSDSKEEHKEDIIQHENIYCNCCSNELDKTLSQIKLGCNHTFHLSCFLIYFEDNNGYVYNVKKCPLCEYDTSKEMEEECCICMENMINDICITKCRHRFHSNCLNEWGKEKGCPMCRALL